MQQKFNGIDERQEEKREVKKGADQTARKKILMALEQWVGCAR